ncbi:MAG: c-type cytochrome [Reichenbachiella sp.]
MRINTQYSSIFIILIIFIVLSSSCEQNEVRKPAYEKPVIEPDPDVDFLTPEESMKTFYLPEGYHVELVASEPMINEPVGMAWDADGKLYVAQMDTYMQDIDGTNENEPWSKIMLLEDVDNDGKMDKSTIFIDSLILPRIVMTLGDELIVSETYNRHLWSYKDTDGDGIADEKIMILEDPVVDRANLEHQPGNLTWNIDNWSYVSRGSLRYRFNKGKIAVDTMRDAPSGQWGLTQDEVGRMYYSSAGGEVPALGFQIHPKYGALELNNRWEEGFVEPWPIIGTPDVQGGLKRLRDDGTLNHFTAVCGQSIFVGDKLPFKGDLFLPEPVGRLVRRAKVENVDGKIILSNTYEKSEFLASTDANFRPVHSETGPDGCLYIIDMYRGIIQEGNWVRKGSFLRPVVERKKLDKNIGKGRIYRIVHDDFEPSKKEKLLNKSAKELIPYLGHANGWYRINAQKLIVLKDDTSVVSELEEIALKKESIFSSSDKDFGIERLHALWTLEGLDALQKKIVLNMLDDNDQRVRSAAIRNCEPYLEENDTEVLDRLEEMIDDSDKNVQIQLVLSLKSSNEQRAKDMILQIMKNDRHNMVIAYTGKEALKNAPPEIEQLRKKHVLKNKNIKEMIIRGYKNYNGLCAECHGKDGMGIGDLAPPLKGSSRVKGNPKTLMKILLNGLKGPVDGKEYTGVMVPMKGYDDKWLADVMTYIRMEFNDKSRVGHWTIKPIRNQVKDRQEYWTLKELENSSSH